MRDPDEELAKRRQLVETVRANQLEAQRQVADAG